MKINSSSDVDFSLFKSGGFMRQKQANLFSIRLRIPVGNLSSNQLLKIAEVCKEYGQDYIHITTRQAVEIPYVHFEKINSIVEELAKAGLEPGSCGPRVRNVVACPGNKHCPYGLGDTENFGISVDEKFFGKDLPHKIKISITGCPNSCTRPQVNDIGFVAVAEPQLEANECISCSLCEEVCPVKAIKMVDGLPVIDRGKCIYTGVCIAVCPNQAFKVLKVGWNIYVGGKVGKQPQLGVLFEEFISEERGLELIDRIIRSYAELGKPEERLGTVVSRVGMVRFRKEVLSGKS